MSARVVGSRATSLAVVLLSLSLLHAAARAEEEPRASGPSGVAPESSAARAGSHLVAIEVGSGGGILDEVRLGGLLRLGARVQRCLSPHQREVAVTAPVRAQASADLIFRDDVTARAAVAYDAELFAGREERPHTGKDHRVVLEELSVEVRDLGGTPLWARLGRQPIARGRGMLVGEDEEGWRRTHDAVLVAWETPTFVLHGWWERYARRGLPGIDGGAWTGRIDAAGLYATRRSWEELGLDVYALGRNDASRPGQREVRATLGARAFGRLADLVEYSFEGAVQLGTQEREGGTDRILAFGAEGLVSLDLRHLPLAPRISLEAALATGDKSARDRRSTTFDPLDEDGHARFGLTDLVLLENLRAVGARFALRPTESLLVELMGHALWVDEPADVTAPRLFAGRGRATDQRFLGDELSTRVRFEPLDYVAVEAGGGALVPGAYAHAHLGGSSVVSRGYFLVELRY